MLETTYPLKQMIFGNFVVTHKLKKNLLTKENKIAFIVSVFIILLVIFISDIQSEWIYQGF